MLKESPLGQATVYIENYAPELLYPVSRNFAREKISLPQILPFSGNDIWNAFEISWLNSKGKPQIALGEFVFPCSSPYIIESKSFKLYLNSFNQSLFESLDAVQAIMEKDLKEITHSQVKVKLLDPSQSHHVKNNEFQGICLDHLDLEITSYTVDPTLLKISSEIVEESLYSHLLKSNCLATGQPDWGSVFISYHGPQIDHASLLKYIISYRRHAGFAEHCVEQIFWDILTHCSPSKLTVYCRYTRRGGLDINPFRSNYEIINFNDRQFRQ